MHSLLALLILIDCIKCFSWVVIENTNHKYIISALPSTDCTKRTNNAGQSRRQRFTNKPFWTLFIEGELFPFGRIRWHSLFTRWHSRGFLPTVRGRIKKHIFSGSFIFLPIGSLANDAPSIRDASLLLYVLQDRILSWREHTISYGFHRCS